MLKPGDTFERYTLEASIGQGGMGSVFRAYDARLGRRVALKVITGEGVSADASARLIREARAAAALDHPNAVSIFDVGELEGQPYIVMELVSGQTLRGSIGDASISMDARLAWLGDVARALGAAHKRGIIHRDIKPENVMVRDDGVIKVLDFGIARRAGGLADPHASTAGPALPTLTVEGVRLGTPVYMAPEQIRGDALDGRADQFAWGVLAFELLTGRLPWRGAGDALAVVASILTDEADGSALDEASVSPAVRDVVRRALAKKPEDRFASMDEAARALDAALRGEVPPSPSPKDASPKDAEGVPPKKGNTDAQRFSTSEVREVLGRAIEREAKAGDASKLGFNDVLEAAREVGVSELALREASRALRRDDDPGSSQAIAPLTKERDAWLRQQRRDFYRHAGVYVIVNVALVKLALLIPFLAPHVVYLWIVVLLWGIGLAIHGLVALTANEDDYTERKQGLEWWYEERRRHHEVALARAQARGIAPAWKPPALKQPARKPGKRARVRVEVPPNADAMKEPTEGADAEAEDAAEAEVAAADITARRSKRR